LSLGKVGPYELVTELEHAAIGSLFGARVASGGEEGRLVLLRRIPIEACTRDETKRLVEVIAIARRVRHSKLAAVLDVVASDREIAVIGEYVDGQTLSSLQRLAIAKRTPFPPAVALRIGVEILHGLRAAREAWRAVAPAEARAALHGGISPDNVFVAAFGDVLLSEVGVCAAAVKLTPFQKLPAIVAYRSPEQLSGNVDRYADERADIFSVGVVLWELLANRPLFGDPERFRAQSSDGNAALVARTLRDVQSMLIPTLGAKDRDGAPIARAAIAVVERALRRDPATRYSGIDQMLGALLALSSDVVASTEQVRAALGRLASAEVEAQRDALGSLWSARPPPASGTPASGPAPDSSRPTLRPQPSAATVAAAPEKAKTTATRPATAEAQFRPQPPSVDQFSRHEAPTYPTAQLEKAPEPQAQQRRQIPASRGLPRLPKSPPVRPPPQTQRPSSIPPPRTTHPPSLPPPPAAPAARLGSTPPPAPARDAPPKSTPPPPPVRTRRSPSTPPPATGAQPLASPPDTPSAGSIPPPTVTAPPVFGDLLRPLPEVPEVFQHAVAQDAKRPTEIAADVRGIARHGAPRALRARRIALVMGGIVVTIGLLALLRALRSPSGDPHEAPTPQALQSTVPAVSVTVPVTAAVTQAPPVASTPVLAGAKPAPPPRELPPPAAARPSPNTAVEPLRPAPRRDDDTRPEERPEPPRKAFRPKGI
jgi:serine/threonine-protein kinase